MRKDEKASVSKVKVIFFTLVIIFILGIGVAIASNVKANNVRIVFPNNYELNIITTKVKVEDILKENHIILLENESTIPNLNENIEENQVILITKTEKQIEEQEIGEVEPLEISDIKDSYTTIVEKIVELEVEIPYETITKDISGTDIEEKTTKIIQEGKNGLKIITYKITYMDNIEVDRLEIGTKIVKEPVNKIIQVNAVPVSRSGGDRTASVNANLYTEVNKNTSLAKMVENIEPKVLTLNASAYTASTCGKTVTDSGYGYTASGSKAKSWYTIAAGKGYPMGTVMYIPYFKDKPNGGWFVVEDRGSAITNSKVDIYMDTYSECKIFGRRNLECYIYEF